MCYLSPAPQALPQAVGVPSGLSPAPQAVPHAAAGSGAVFFFQLNKFESAILFTSVVLFLRAVCCSL